MRYDLGSQLLQWFAAGLDEDICMARFLYCREGDEDDSGVGYLDKSQLEDHNCV